MSVESSEVQARRRSLLGNFLTSERLISSIPLILLLIVFIVISLIVPFFLTSNNLISVLLQASALGLLAIGEAAVLITGGIDLSMPGNMAMGAIMGAMLMRAGGNPALAVLIMIAVSTALGAINGYSVAYLKMIPFVVTLAMQAIVFGAAIWITNQVSISGLPGAFIDSVMASVAGIPLPVLFMFLMTITVQLFMTRSIFGRWLYATGTNIRAARVSGVPTQKILFFVYAFSGFMAGVAGVILTARLFSAGAQMGRDTVVLDIVSSAALGGVSIYGGVGTALNAVIGAILITLINNVMNMANISYYVTLVVKGLVIIAVVAIDYLRRR